MVDQERFQLSEAVVMTEGKRILFAIPWGSRVILGTTDTDYEGSLDDVRADPADTSHVLNVVNRAFPQAELQPSDVISTWAGVRPLIAPAGVQKAAPSDTSRDHQIRMPEPGWIDVAGGKLTTYRLMAEQTLDQIGEYLKRSLSPCRTGEEPLIAPADAATSSIIPPPVTREAVQRYCMKEWATDVSDVMLRRTSWGQYYPQHEAGQIARQVSQWMAEALG